MVFMFCWHKAFSASAKMLSGPVAFPFFIRCITCSSFSVRKFCAVDAWSCRIGSLSSSYNSVTYSLPIFALSLLRQTSCSHLYLWCTQHCHCGLFDFLMHFLVFNCISITIISVHWTLNIEPFVHLLSYNHFWFLHPTFGFWYLHIVFSFSCLMWSICSKYYPESYTLASCLQVFWELLF